MYIKKLFIKYFVLSVCESFARAQLVLIIFLILAHPVYKMWITQEPNKLKLWNKLHFEEKKKTESIYQV